MKMLCGRVISSTLVLYSLNVWRGSPTSMSIVLRGRYPWQWSMAAKD